ncbi:gamma-glutamyltransferase 2. Threonine peptidase. MEROPS family T03 [Roseovarius nanhaiticus]|uniref:Gamma-glutamyltransferase 2. Threonine peptidase. MEROPS family T03 n=1 Tax=Roseovarius nanhaiticus TaxID=573024 RepID=A0A1N7EDI8_9RHOB|nr:gamma-glutamyltransferase family protein [Roseovarius nanhaiticus]SEK77252.1 gamma-glutamyltransferase 2. Threonine peptidase. MEROPS family T03 [Roseovarius nanhaiticus]SIR85985.1 gamma-glutamyltransferase 2. Threonine peptidase. MEROPS family T03 [Roseovarius nanhaiticus]
MTDAPLYATHRTPVYARNMVATSQPLAAQAGLRILAEGGNAVDAALATAICLTVVEPTGNGLGSDAFAILWDGAKLHGLNATGRAPAAWTDAQFDGGVPQRGWGAVTVPGAVSAWVMLSRAHGRLPFARLFAPAIGYARDGFAVSPTIAGLWAKGAQLLRDQPGFAECFMPEGRAPRAGEVFRNEALAQTLELIADTEGEAFYRGALAEKIAEAARANGASLSAEDMAAHEADWCGTIQMPFRGAELHEIPPNGQGIAALIALGLVDRTAVADYGPDDPIALHLQIEATKLALADTAAHVGDPKAMAFGPEALLADGYLDARAALIDPACAGDPGAGAPRAGGTVYLTAADAEGRMVSFIQSNYMGFGAGVVVPGTGIHMQNRGAGFVAERGHPAAVGPSRRPFHTIIPGFVTRGGAPEMSFGVMGGPMQAQGHLQMMLRTMLWGQDPQAASDAPRWQVVSGRRVAVEDGMPDATVAALQAMGHDVARGGTAAEFGFGGAQLIRRVEGGYVAGSDHRKDGYAAGY